MKMKKISALFAAVLLGASLFSGCSSKEEPKETKETVAEDVEEEEVTDEAEEEPAEEATDETEEEPAEEPAASGEMTNNWADNQIQIKGKVLTLPFSLVELNIMGFDFENLGEYAVNPQQAVYGKSLYDAEGNAVSGVYSNLSDEIVDIRQTSMTSITIKKDYRTSSNENLDVVLPGNIQFGDSLETIKAALGEPTKVDEMDSSTFVKYEDPDNYRHYAQFSLWEDKVIEYTLYVQ